MKSLVLALSLSLSTLYSCSNTCSKSTCDHGQCISGDCVCEPGFLGIDCTGQRTPTQIIIDQIRAIPDNAPGSLRVVLRTDTEILYSSPAQGSPFEFSAPFTVAITEPLGSVVLEAHDATDQIGAIRFTPYSNDNDFPETLTVQAAGVPVQFQLDARYEF